MELSGPASGRRARNILRKARAHPAAKLITLLTDFGLKDPYVGILKGVIHTIAGAHAFPPGGRVSPSTGKAIPTTNPSHWLKGDSPAIIIDITHDVEAQDVREGAFFIEEYYRFFPVGTVHVAIVDPTVGSDRRPIILSRDQHFFVGPDNGIFTLIMGNDPEVYLIENPGFMLKDISSTFHGRDIFAPAAAYLSKGVRPSAFGEHITDPLRLQNVFPRAGRNTLKGEVVRFDHFGNAITNIKVEYLTDFLRGRPFKVRIAGITFTTINKSYYEDTVTCLIGSSGYLEFGFFKGSFAGMTQIGKSEQVTVKC